MIKRYYSNGKLLLSGEYLILDGALGLALPTTFGQSLEVELTESDLLNWKSLDETGAVWFEWAFDLKMFREDIGKFPIGPAEAPQVAKTLAKLLFEANMLNRGFLSGTNGFSVTTRLSFPRNWGLGSSSTLVNNIAQWADVNAYELLWRTLGGSGYDVACAKHNNPLLYSLKGTSPIVEEINFCPPFKDQLYFVFLNQKQSSADAITNYKSLDFDKRKAIEELSAITREMASCQDAQTFGALMRLHEKILSSLLKKKTVKESLFYDFLGDIKSLGAWGGDFIMVLGDNGTPAYFKDKKYLTVIPYAKMAL